MMFKDSASLLVIRTAKAVLTRARVFRWELQPHDEKSGVRVLLYHRVTDGSDPLALSPRKFQMQMQYLAENDFRVLDVVTALDLLVAGRLEPRTVALTFDDGFRDVLDNAHDVLDELGFSATVFVATDVIDGKIPYPWASDQEDTLGWEEIRRLDAEGTFRFEPHSLTHPDLTRLDDASARREISSSKLVLEAKLERETQAFCYPGGFFGPRERQMVYDAGFRYGITCEPGLNTAASDVFLAHRVQIDKTDGLREFRAKVGGSHDRPLIGRASYRRLRYGSLK